MNTLKMGLIGLMIGAAVAVGTATVDSEETVAAVCCSACDTNYDACFDGCGGDSACISSCGTKFVACTRTCNNGC
ncbi:hypothetical protein JY651_18010 [Pyxidicoccus parkwayensis]|jgi:hypothetical protein|uniref:Uncharacterized protein n=1 Tax=Pyxidicoccus parkwayensis TaxID=2813578 RepID=A0ABX7P8F1_9BACT|nr:hypothetical protein [Pyxidicoccus parkwaysis]QSQ26706.1 hypothetical protein JY651_18010 [Pyxidicoccus parkwaysis]